jgi:hypothetical protein
MYCETQTTYATYNETQSTYVLWLTMQMASTREINLEWLIPSFESIRKQ